MPKAVAGFLLLAMSLFAEQDAARAPAQPSGVISTAGSATVIREGESLFRANCSPCHGLAGQGGARGPDLSSGHWNHGGSDAEISHTIENGVPGTEMPANGFEESEIQSLVAYLRSLRPSTALPAGDSKTGELLFFGKEACANCHMVSGRGGVLGPELTRVGASRSLTYLIDSIRHPDQDFSKLPVDPNNHYSVPLEWASVTVVTRQGQRIRGVAKNEDAFSLQLIGEDSHLYLLLKKDLIEVRHERRSLMPAYSEQQLSAAELRDLLSYLASLRGGEK